MDLNAERINRKHENDSVTVTADVLPETVAVAPDVETTADTQPPTRQTEMALDELASQVEAAVTQSPQSLAETISELEQVHENAAFDTTLDSSDTDDLSAGFTTDTPTPANLERRTETSEFESLSTPPSHSATADNSILVDDDDPIVLDEADGADVASYPFGQTDRDDNLQEIFGIGPVAERALRKLGITSYTQIAALEREHIEFIADQLDIFPGRIERDDWVGSAKRRLEQEFEHNNASTGNTTDLPELEDA